MPKIEIRYFAALREAAGRSQEDVYTEAPDLAGLYRELQSQYGFTLAVNQIKASLNGHWSDLESEIKDGDQVVFIPPVAGG